MRVSASTFRMTKACRDVEYCPEINVVRQQHALGADTVRQGRGPETKEGAYLAGLSPCFSCDARRALRLQGQDFTLRQTKGGWRAISKGKIVPAKRVHAYLCKAFGEDLGPVRAALRALGAIFSHAHLTATHIR